MLLVLSTVDIEHTLLHSHATTLATAALLLVATVFLICRELAFQHRTNTATQAKTPSVPHREPAPHPPAVVGQAPETRRRLDVTNEPVAAVAEILKHTAATPSYLFKLYAHLGNPRRRYSKLALILALFRFLLPRRHRHKMLH